MTSIQIRETKLPGVGVEHEFTTDSGERVGVISHHTGRRDLVVYDVQDPDLCRLALQFSEDEAATLGSLLGAFQVVESLSTVQQAVGGLAIDWIPIRDGWACNGATLAQLALTRRGVNIIAVVRGDETIPVPQAEFALRSGDTLIVVGKPESIQTAYDLMQQGTP